MTRPLRRSLLAMALIISTAVVALGAGAPPAAIAQDEQPVVLTLVRQTPFTFPEEPDLNVEVAVLNQGEETLDELSLEVTVFSQVFSRSEFDAALVADPAGAPVVSGTEPLKNPLDPGVGRAVAVRVPMDVPGVSTEQSFVYPVRIDLLSGGVPISTLRSGVVFVVRSPVEPLALNWRVTLTAPWSLDPNGVFRSPTLERQISKGGRLRGIVDALVQTVEAPGASAADVAVSPLLLLQLERMKLGYRVLDGGSVREVPAGEAGSAAAGRLLQDLREIEASERIEIVALPFSSPTYPSIVEGLARDLGDQIDLGREVVRRLVGPPDGGSDAPVGSAIDDRVLKRLSARGVLRLLVDAESVPGRAQAPGFSAPPTSLLAADDAQLTAVVPEPAVQSLITSETAMTNPVLGAQQTLAGLATIWTELTGVQRGIALSIPADASAAFTEALIKRLVAVNRTPQARFLKSRTASQLVAAFPPADLPEPFVQLDDRRFSESYTTSIKSASRGVAAYRSMLAEPSDVPGTLDRQLLVAEGSQFLGNESEGGAYVNAVRDRLAEAFGDVRAETAELVTLSSSNGTIPVRLVNETGAPVKVSVQLVSDQLTPGPSYSREVQLDEPERTITFAVELGTTGQIPVRVVVSAPSGRPINETTIGVRSTAYNRVALIITIGAALVLLALWSRRYFPRRKS